MMDMNEVQWLDTQNILGQYYRVDLYVNRPIFVYGTCFGLQTLQEWWLCWLSQILYPFRIPCGTSYIVCPRWIRVWCPILCNQKHHHEKPKTQMMRNYECKVQTISGPYTYVYNDIEICMYTNIKENKPDIALTWNCWACKQLEAN